MGGALATLGVFGSGVFAICNSVVGRKILDAGLRYVVKSERADRVERMIDSTLGHVIPIVLKWFGLFLKWTLEFLQSTVGSSVAFLKSTWEENDSTAGEDDASVAGETELDGSEDPGRAGRPKKKYSPSQASDFGPNTADSGTNVSNARHRKRQLPKHESEGYEFSGQKSHSWITPKVVLGLWAGYMAICWTSFSILRSFERGVLRNDKLAALAICKKERGEPNCGVQRAAVLAFDSTNGFWYAVSTGARDVDIPGGIFPIWSWISAVYNSQNLADYVLLAVIICIITAGALAGKALYSYMTKPIPKQKKLV